MIKLKVLGWNNSPPFYVQFFPMKLTKKKLYSEQETPKSLNINGKSFAFFEGLLALYIYLLFVLTAMSAKHPRRKFQFWWLIWNHLLPKKKRNIIERTQMFCVHVKLSWWKIDICNRIQDTSMYSLVRNSNFRIKNHNNFVNNL